MQTIEETVKSIILDHLANGNGIEITFKTNLIKDIGMDSIYLMMIVVLLEEKFNIELPDEFLSEDNLSSYGNIVAMVKTILANKK